LYKKERIGTEMASEPIWGVGPKMDCFVNVKARAGIEEGIRNGY
jgi:hypothetical protein